MCFAPFLVGCDKTSEGFFAVVGGMGVCTLSVSKGEFRLVPGDLPAGYKEKMALVLRLILYFMVQPAAFFRGGLIFACSRSLGEFRLF